MWPQPFLWLTTTDQCWPLVLKLHSRDMSGFLRVWYALSYGEQLLFQRNFCYHTIWERIRVQKQKLWGIFPGKRGPENHFEIMAAKPAHNLGSYRLIYPLPRVGKPNSWSEMEKNLHSLD